jgi:RNA polymerase sigma-70 factor (ECF subfamily)
VTDHEQDGLAERFEENRTHLRAVAYRMLGSLSEADDAVQESWLRLSRSGTSGVENLGGWLTTVTARVCLDILRSRKSRREEPLGAHVPEPVVTREDGVDPEYEVLLAESVGLALLVVLETLAPAGRVAFVLHGRGARLGPGRTPACRIRLRAQAREDRRNRHDRPPGAPSPARPGGPQRLTSQPTFRGGWPCH